MKAMQIMDVHIAEYINFPKNENIILSYNVWLVEQRVMADDHDKADYITQTYINELNADKHFYQLMETGKLNAVLDSFKKHTDCRFSYMDERLGFVVVDKRPIRCLMR